jgi:hypothetical protein
MGNSKPMTMAGSLGGAKFKVPEHVVFRRFPAETVVLNLQTGKYHGLNPTAGGMLEALSASGSIPPAAAKVAEEYGRDPAAIEADLRKLCKALLERGLLEIDGEPAG